MRQVPRRSRETSGLPARGFALARGQYRVGAGLELELAAAAADVESVEQLI